MFGFAELKHAFNGLDLADKPVIVHASLKKFGNIQGGAATVIQVMRESFNGVIAPTFTYKTMVTPEVGPPNNGITYGSDHNANKMAEPFNHAMPPDKMMGQLPLALLRESGATRTTHPILSFGGILADEILSTQTLLDPLAPIGALAEKDGHVLLINVDHSVDTSIHYAEKLARRKQFMRWALTTERIVECPGFPGDSSGFNAIEERLQPHTRRIDLDGGIFLQAISLKRLLDLAVELIEQKPLALLCQRSDCERCNAVRNS